MKLGPTSVVTQASRVASRVVEGQAVVIVIDAQRLHTLNAVGTFVWDHAEAKVSLGELADRVVAEYEVTKEQAMADVLTFADELVGLGALEVVAP